jgi:hypothetical protein
MKTTRSDVRVDGPVETALPVARQGSSSWNDSGSSNDSGSEWDAGPLRPIAHWVLMPPSGGRSRLEMVWEVPDPISAIV